MRHCFHRTISAAPAPHLIAILMLAALVSAFDVIGRETQLIPPVVVTKSSNPSAGAGKFYGGGAPRAHAPIPQLRGRPGGAARARPRPGSEPVPHLQGGR